MKTWQISPHENLGIHQKSLPPPPKRYGNVHKHRFSKEFKQAMEDEFNKLLSQGMFKIVPIAEAIRHSQTPLPLMWVFAYKFNKAAMLQRFKARLVARGDLFEDIQARSQLYAATLAARSLRLLLAIIAYFDLSTIQFDAVNAFGQVDLEKPVFTKFPPGKDQPGFCIRLKKALYGLPEAPKLWQIHLTRTLVTLGMTMVPEEPLPLPYVRYSHVFPCRRYDYCL